MPKPQLTVDQFSRAHSVAEAARLKGCHPRTIERHIALGNLRVVRAGWLVRILPADLARWQVPRGKRATLPASALTAPALATLTERERAVIDMHHGLDGGDRYTLAEIGRRFRVTRERARQIAAQARRKLRAYARAQRAG